ncbi:MAG: hypothetical protein HZB56_22705 [Deltaproteobacteria bacterium]|nr:hypothetical protein [Deltaproteobacteria bacterium]
MTLPTREWFEKEALGRLRSGDLFDHPVPVIPVMTRGRAYGSISRRAVAAGAKIPNLSLAQASHDDRFIYVALWDDDSAYSDLSIASCAVAALREACALGLEHLFLPVLGGREGMRYLWAAEKGIFEYADDLEEAGKAYPEHHYVITGEVS